MAKGFVINVPITKAYKSSNGKRHIVGMVSDTIPDRQGDIVSTEALRSMAKQICWGDQKIELLANHKDAFGFGVAHEAWVKEKEEHHGEWELYVDFELKDNYPQADELWDGVSSGSSDKQLSIGGSTPKKMIAFSRVEGKVYRVLEDLILNHIATTRANFAANDNTSFVSAIVKSMSEVEMCSDNKNIRDYLEKDLEKGNVLVYGVTSNANSDEQEDHFHEFVIEFDSDGDVVDGETSYVKGHTHDITDHIKTGSNGKHPHTHLLRLSDNRMFKLPNNTRIMKPSMDSETLTDGNIVEERNIDESDSVVYNDTPSDGIDKSEDAPINTTLKSDSSDIQKQEVTQMGNENPSNSEDVGMTPPEVALADDEMVSKANEAVGFFARLSDFLKGRKSEETISKSVGILMNAVDDVENDELSETDVETLTSIFGRMRELCGLTTHSVDTEETSESSVAETPDLQALITEAVESAVAERLAVSSESEVSEETETEESEADEAEDSEEEVTEKEVSEIVEETEVSSVEKAIEEGFKNLTNRLETLEELSGVSQNNKGEEKGSEGSLSVFNGLFSHAISDAGYKTNSKEGN